MIEIKYIVLMMLSLCLLLSIVIPCYSFFKSKYGKICLPQKFLMDENSFVGVVKVLRHIMDFYGKKVKLDFSQVDELSYEAFMILVAQGEKAFYKGKTVYLSSVPHEKKEIVSIILGKNKNYKTYHNYIKLGDRGASLFQQNSKINPKLTIGIEAELKRMGIRNYYEFNTFITELVGNAIEHGIKHRNINWWMYHYRNNETKTIAFVFVDMGVGIIRSYKEAGLSSEYKGMPDRDILLKALDGILGSSTKQANRGRGLPQVKRMVEKMWISDFVLITNCVSLRYIDGAFTVKQHSNFVGTYYSWTISKENFNKWKEESI